MYKLQSPDFTSICTRLSTPDGGLVVYANITRRYIIGIGTLCLLYSGCGRTLGLLCAWNRVAALVSLFLFCAFANFPLCTFCWNSGWK